jgi:hypothetical protein
MWCPQLNGSLWISEIAPRFGGASQANLGLDLENVEKGPILDPADFTAPASGEAHRVRASIDLSQKDVDRGLQLRIRAVGIADIERHFMIGRDALAFEPFTVYQDVGNGDQQQISI